MTSPIQAAIEQLRASVEALPEHLRGPWLSFNEQVYVEYNGNDHVFAWVDVDARSRPDPANAEIAAEVARLHNVTGALARLLELLLALDRDRADLNISDLHDYVIDTCAAARALAEAITRRIPS